MVSGLIIVFVVVAVGVAIARAVITPAGQARRRYRQRALFYPYNEANIRAREDPGCHLPEGMDHGGAHGADHHGGGFAGEHGGFGGGDPGGHHG
jgi:hypothetical protein